ncbi:MAG: prolyl oligopeptidase family serine peptidase [Bacteroidetes Order II. Incertae sedis bacterium]|jgi:dipeptidyl-peptidase 4|nr:prolyl oligopeptidase family serine peptidase [Bacteroidetes Order II. bacterium]MBT6201182.1 prolyl oligopeptidase family serine peptidase [Bacteroidetes Order II. bacterium]MBT6599025.1 prolyl oligopeptidase family serine peptidase [Bacteroidetes Order II. bacterium]MBT7402086.1 prolyl oligopeptidase family serine peptidase [Bacteroidetes Order II. bacterium]
MKKTSVLSVFLFGLLLATPTANGQEVTEEDYARAEGFLSSYTSPLVFKTSVSANWYADSKMWYLNRVQGGTEFIKVDARRGKRGPAFDHTRLARSISTALDSTISPSNLPFTSFEFTKGDRGMTFHAEGYDFSCTFRRYACETVEADAPAGSVNPMFARFRAMRGATIDSPDGKKEAFIREHNLWVRDKETKEERQMTDDGELDFGYATNNAGWTKSDRPVLVWSPDSKKIATFQHDGRGVGEMYLVSTATGHPDLEAWKYPLPGDSLIFRIERVVIDVENAQVVRLNMPPDAHRSTITDHVAYQGGWADVEWSTDSAELSFVSSSRDHQDAWLRVADPETGEVKQVLHEHQDTFFESGIGGLNWRFLSDSNEFIWFSQRDNWGHLYLYDQVTGALKNQITTGDWNVRTIQFIDEEAREIYFMGSGREEGDPYFVYLYKVNFDGSGMQVLSPNYGNHSITFSPDRAYFVDTYSQPDTPHVSELRSLEGDLVVDLEEADISALVASGWKPPIQVKVKGRDGTTDIHGLMYTPTNLDETKKYPVLNYIYPGPQTGSVGGRSFSPSRSDKQALSELGFIVVEVDGMGTPGRSKSFHDTYYGNMGDNTLPDQIAAIKELAARHGFLDTERVGIWGHSGGGFASAAALMRYPGFYDVAVSGAGNHDNRTYEDDWGEKWQGLLVENEDGTTNYDNQATQLEVDKLEGKLLIAHGTMDSNVPPNNTLQLVTKLMDANKDFDLLMFPNSRHGFRQGSYWMRKRWDYFVKHLIGAEPPKEYTFGERPPRTAL